MNIESANERKVECPQCESVDVVQFSLFGETLMTSKYHCNRCGSDFEAIRWQKRE